MNIKNIYIISLALYLCACTATYQNYVPAPHEMPVETNFLQTQNKIQNQIPEELITVHSTQKIKPEILQALMKTRGFIYKGSRNIRSQYLPSESNIKKAAYTIGASYALYFIANQETIREEKERIDIGTLVGGLIGAKNKRQTGDAIERGLKTHKYAENVTYYDYHITYLSKIEGEKSIILNKNEVSLLTNEHTSIKNEVANLANRIKRLEIQKRKIEHHTRLEDRNSNSGLLEINKQMMEMQENIKLLHNYIKEIDNALKTNHSAIDGIHGNIGFDDVPSQY